MENTGNTGEIPNWPVVRPPLFLGGIHVSPINEFLINEEYRMVSKSKPYLDYDLYFGKYIKEPVCNKFVSLNKPIILNAIQVVNDMSSGMVSSFIGEIIPMPILDFFPILLSLVRDNPDGENPIRGLSMHNANVFKVKDMGSKIFDISVFWYKKEKYWYIFSQKYEDDIIRHRGNILYEVVFNQNE